MFHFSLKKLTKTGVTVTIFALFAISAACSHEQIRQTELPEPVDAMAASTPTPEPLVDQPAPAPKPTRHHARKHLARSTRVAKHSTKAKHSHRLVARHASKTKSIAKANPKLSAVGQVEIQLPPAPPTAQIAPPAPLQQSMAPTDAQEGHLLWTWFGMLAVLSVLFMGVVRARRLRSSRAIVYNS